MADEKASDKAVDAAIKEANDAFAAMGKAVEEAAKGKEQLDVLAVARKAGLRDLDEGVLRELEIPRLVPVHPWLPWHLWWPWRPLWCWWWHRYHPWYRWCCPWWWYRCHWYPH